jgi:hypothetical protein
MQLPPYATREDIKDALDVLETARANFEIDRQLQAASRLIDERMHRKFFPLIDTRSFDWPNIQTPWPWRLWLDQHELISLTQLSSGGILIPSANVKLYPTDGPPYDHLELDISTSSAFTAAQTWQYSITGQGLFGFRADELAAGTVPTGGLDSVSTSISLGIPAYRGVGSLLRIDTERMIVTNRTMISSGQALGAGGLAMQNAANLCPVADITQFAVGEALLIDGERMRVEDTAGTNLVVKRAWDGSVLGAHTAGTTIYANRQLTVVRGALGTTAASHTATTGVFEHDPPSPIRQLAVAQAVVNLVQTRAGYPQATTSRGRSGETDVKPGTPPSNLSDLWADAETAYRRKARLRSV